MIKGASIMIHTHQTAPTQFVEANSIRFAYRRFGKTGGVPLVFSQHYIGTMDYWDPTVTDGLARDREVILFDNAGVSSSSARRSGNGVDSPGYRAALWCPPPRSARECLARGQIQSVRCGPGGGTGVPEAHASSARGPRSRSERQGVARPGRSDWQVGRPAKGVHRLSEDDQAANTRRERQ